MKYRKSEFEGCIKKEIWIEVPRGDWGLCWYFLGKWTANPIYFIYEWCGQTNGG